MPTSPPRRRSRVLRRYQTSVVQSLLRGLSRERGATFTVLFPRQAGKNEVAAGLVSALLRMHAAEGGSIVVCAPTFEPQAAISLDRVRGALEATAHLFPSAGVHRVQGHTISVGNASCVFLSASPEANVAGHTASLALIADEAQDIDRDWFDRQFRPMCASTGANTVLFGTPWDGDSLLDRAVAANRSFDASRPGRRHADWIPRHFEVLWQEVAASLPAYGSYVETERKRLGDGHPNFRTQYLLETLSARARLLSDAQLLRLDGAHARLRAPQPGERYVAGLDVAGEGRDRTVLSIARLEGEGIAVVHHVAWQRDAYDTMGNDVLALVHQWRFERLCMDHTGLGAPLGQRLERAVPRIAEQVAFTSHSKSELGYALTAAVETGRLALYADDASRESAACRAELQDLQAVFLPGGLLQWHAARGHDDYAVSLALCVRAAGHDAGPRIARARRQE